MPSSPHRHRIEIPASLYAQLAAQAAREDSTVASVVVAHIVNGLALDEHYGPLAGQIAELRRELRQFIQTQTARDASPLSKIATDPSTHDAS
jgi:hypothetical protein